MLAILAGLGVRQYLKPSGFGEIGFFRTAALDEEAAREPTLQGKGACEVCHKAEFDAHEKDVHLTVQCEDCHGPAAEHVQARTDGLAPDKGKMFRELAQANCLACHRRLQARPKLFPTIDAAEHFTRMGVTDSSVKCQGCHSPHEPLFLDRKVSQARLHPLIHACTDCHLDPAIRSKALPDGHVVTFQCKDCHADVLADYKTKPHKDLECSTCHVFHQDSEFSGRIFKNGNPKFCLMCHQQQPFRGKGSIPQLASFEAHRNEMASDDADRQKRCVDCHAEEKIHTMHRPAKSVVVGEGGAR
jgi:predicted CXXCH cytochrome family protein